MGLGYSRKGVVKHALPDRGDEAEIAYDRR
jgi:hypothetical protein